MAGIVEKLYPPIIAGSIPAFYSVGGTATIAVPFIMNKAVGYNDISGFKLKIKTVQSNTYLTTLTAPLNSTDLTNNIVRFNWSVTKEDKSFNQIVIGQFLKVQLAYYKDEKINNEISTTIGYYSTIGIIKYTSQPKVSLVFNKQLNKSFILPFQEIYYGKYILGEDKSERPYSYIFSLYNKNDELVETSGWQLHNSSIEETDLKSTLDSYRFEINLIKNEKYKVQYGVRTINGLEIYTPLFECMDINIIKSSIDNALYAKNVFDDGYIELFFDKNNLIDINKDKPISIEILRTEKKYQYNSWKVLGKRYFSNIEDFLNWSFKDFTIEQGIYYKYAIRQYDAKGNYSIMKIAQDIYTKKEEVFADFEDMFLWDGQRQIKIKFNPKITSFKTTVLESKTDTIGSQYPFIFRNGEVRYKEFPISGMISYLMDENSLFLNHIEDLGIYMSDALSRDSSPSKTTDFLQAATLNLVGYNISAERIFKIKLLDWLNNGEIKLFKSPAEGNYLVRLINISLTPEDKLNRMLHTFSATAYEMKDFTYNNLLELGFIKIKELEQETIYIKSVLLSDVIRQNFEKIKNGQSVKINSQDILNLLSLKTTSGNFYPNFIIRLGEDTPAAKTKITTREFVLQKINETLPDVYFNGIDNYLSDEMISMEKMIDLVGDAVLTYQYKLSKILIGELNNNGKTLEQAGIQDIVETIVGPEIKIFNQNTDYIEEQLLCIFSLNFRKKAIMPYPKEGMLLDENCLYFKDDIYYMAKNNELISIGDQIDYNITLIDQDDLEYNFNTAPIINVNDRLYKKIILGSGFCADCAYQVKKIIYQKEN